MEQFFDRIISKNGFVDLHIHTNDSYGEEMNQMNYTPEELLESVKIYTDNNNCPATFALTDHNSIEGVKKIQDKIKANPKDYENINYITGCEFTCSAGSLGTIINGEGHKKNLIKNFHMLAYDFDPNNKDLNFLCKLYSTRRENTIIVKTNNGSLKVPAGSYVLALRNLLKDNGINLPLNEFAAINLNTNDIKMNKQKFISYLMNFAEKYNLEDSVKKDIFKQLMERNVDGLGKPDCMEVMEIVENAGGYCVLAHPNNLKISSAYKSNIPQAIKILENYLRKNNIPFKQDSSMQKLLISYVSYAMSHLAKSPITGKELNGIVGLETLHTSALFKQGVLDHIVSCANQNNLYLTVGSDSHGTLHQMSMLSKFLPMEALDSKKKNNVVVTDCLFADKILDGTLKDNLTCNQDFEHQFQIIKTDKYEEIELDMNDIKNIVSNCVIDDKQFTR